MPNSHSAGWRLDAKFDDFKDRAVGGGIRYQRVLTLAAC